jgi:uncharacterized membrane protein YphA (DoxX/SURF4 family)
MSDGTRQRAGWAGGRGRGWAGARFRSPLGRAEEQAIADTAAPPAQPPAGAVRTGSAPAGPAAAGPAPAGAVRTGSAPAGWRGAAGRAGDLAGQWAPTAGRILLGLVLAWFGYHELLLPGEWTGYVPVINETSNLAIVAVLVHGWALLVLAVALIAGIAPRVSAAIASVLLLEIVISLSVSGLSDTSMRDVGVLGLAICLTGCRDQRLVLRG